MASAFIQSLESSEVTRIWVACVQKLEDESQHLRLFTRTAIGWVRDHSLENRLNPIVPPAIKPLKVIGHLHVAERPGKIGS